MAPGKLDPILALERMREFGLEPLTEYPGAKQTARLSKLPTTKTLEQEVN